MLDFGQFDFGQFDFGQLAEVENWSRSRSEGERGERGGGGWFGGVGRYRGF